MAAVALGPGTGSAIAVGPASGTFVVAAAALGPGMGSANVVGPASAGRFDVAAAALGPGPMRPDPQEWDDLSLGRFLRRGTDTGRDPKGH